MAGTKSQNPPSDATAYEFHDIADFFPLMEGKPFDELVADIKAHGLKEQVNLWQGKIIDGRNRYRACLAAGVKPIFKAQTWETEAEALDYVTSRNIQRRHLTTAQRSLAAARISTRRGKRGSAAPLTQSKAAEMLGVSIRSVKNAKAVIELAPELLPAVEAGQIGLETAADAARHPDSFEGWEPAGEPAPTGWDDQAEAAPAAAQIGDQFALEPQEPTEPSPKPLTKAQQKIAEEAARKVRAKTKRDAKKASAAKLTPPEREAIAKAKGVEDLLDVARGEGATWDDVVRKWWATTSEAQRQRFHDDAVEPWLKARPAVELADVITSDPPEPLKPKRPKPDGVADAGQMLPATAQG